MRKVLFRKYVPIWEDYLLPGTFPDAIRARPYTVVAQESPP
jgi:hypothetical protein